METLAKCLEPKTSQQTGKDGSWSYHGKRAIETSGLRPIPNLPEFSRAC